MTKSFFLGSAETPKVTVSSPSPDRLKRMKRRLLKGIMWGAVAEMEWGKLPNEHRFILGAAGKTLPLTSILSAMKKKD